MSRKITAGMAGVQLNMSVDAISFSAHADYPQTQQFFDALGAAARHPRARRSRGDGRLKRALDAKAAADEKR